MVQKNVGFCFRDGKILLTNLIFKKWSIEYLLVTVSNKANDEMWINTRVKILFLQYLFLYLPWINSVHGFFVCLFSDTSGWYCCYTKMKEILPFFTLVLNLLSMRQVGNDVTQTFKLLSQIYLAFINKLSPRSFVILLVWVEQE